MHPRVLPDALERLPGVTLQNEQGNPYQPNLSLRGFFASPVTGLPQGVSVFLDGVRINEPTVEEVNFDLIPLDDAELVEVIRGTSVLFGRNTLGAAVTITTRRGQERFELVPDISGGSFGRQNYVLRLGGTAGPFDYYLGTRYTDETGWRDDSETRIGRVLAKLGLRKGDLDATVSYQYSNDRIKQPGSLPSYEVSRNPTAELHRGRLLRARAQHGHRQRELRAHRAPQARGQCLRAGAQRGAIQRQPDRRGHAALELHALRRRPPAGEPTEARSSGETTC